MKKIPIMFCFNNNYALPASACFISIMEHASKNNKYIFNVLHSDITQENMDLLNKDMSKYKNCELKFINMNNKFEEEYEKIENHSHFSKELLYKLSCSSIFPKEDKIIITDVDVIFLDDIAKMYDAMDTSEDFYYAGVGPIKKKEVSIYRGDFYKKFSEKEKEMLEEGIGAGFLLVNLKKHREDDLENKLMKYLDENSNRLIQIEQDVFNIVCNKKLKKLPYRYMICTFEYNDFKDLNDFSLLSDEENVEEIKEAILKPVQLHYATPLKPWIYTDTKKSEIWFEYFEKSSFSPLYLESIKKNGKSVNSFKIRFMKTKLYSFMLDVYHFLKKIFKRR